MAGISHDEFEQHTREIQRQLDKLMAETLPSQVIGQFAARAELRKLRDVVDAQQKQIKLLFRAIEDLALG